MKTAPLKGMRDTLPREMRIRDYVQGKILETYRASGFERISTPMLEDMENLDKSDGGDNLNLIFKVLKRGEKLEKALASGNEKDLSDMGLRYDLTLPLTRFYAANREKLPVPFKVIQTDRVFRAERPQKGRLREFVQCDIDILGDASPNAEIELIDTTARALMNIGFEGFTVRVNDRRLLRGMLKNFGFPEDSLDSVCVSFDKLDKIGAEGVAAELREKELPETAVAALADFLAKDTPSLDAVASLCGDDALASALRRVIGTVTKLAGGRYAIEYAPSLVRGQGYYTGMVFEVAAQGFAGAVAGGGRYDHLVGKFIGQGRARRGLLHRLRAHLRHPARQRVRHPRAQAPHRARLSRGRRLRRRARQGRRAARRVRRHRRRRRKEGRQAARPPPAGRRVRRVLLRQIPRGQTLLTLFPAKRKPPRPCWPRRLFVCAPRGGTRRDEKLFFHIFIHMV